MPHQFSKNIAHSNYERIAILSKCCLCCQDEAGRTLSQLAAAGVHAVEITGLARPADPTRARTHLYPPFGSELVFKTAPTVRPLVAAYTGSFVGAAHVIHALLEHPPLEPHLVKAFALGRVDPKNVAGHIFFMRLDDCELSGLESPHLTRQPPYAAAFFEQTDPPGAFIRLIVCDGVLCHCPSLVGTAFERARAPIDKCQRPLCLSRDNRAKARDDANDSAEVQ